MTQDEIIEMARRSNILEKMGYENSDMKNWRDDVLRELSIFAKLVTQNEREACAKICDTLAKPYPIGLREQICAATIRARGEQHD